jgi:hypothetical protein
MSSQIRDLRETLLGWKAYFDLSEVLSPLRDLDKWLRRRLRWYRPPPTAHRPHPAPRERGVSPRAGTFAPGRRRAASVLRQHLEYLCSMRDSPTSADASKAGIAGYTSNR